MKIISSTPLLLAAIATLAAGPAAAGNWHLSGIADFRASIASQDRSWVDGGFGKLRTGGDGDGESKGHTKIPQLALDVRLQPLPAITVAASAEYLRVDRPQLELLEAWARYRPVSTTPWRWSVKGGAFFPNLSMENTGPAWSPVWTVTPSAINTWVGEELRSVGLEPRLEYRGETATWDLGAAAFWDNEAAGELMAYRGWALSDAVYGFGARVREPDARARDEYGQPSARFNPFQELDNRAGWHADLGWRSPAYGELRVLHYDNNVANPPPESEEAAPVYAWHTRFWSLSGQTQLGPLTLIAQAMDGSARVHHDDEDPERTRFRSAFLLGGVQLGAWRPALRVDLFSTHEFTGEEDMGIRERGSAVTAALGWRQRDWLRWTAEASRVQGQRNQREEDGLPEHFVNSQFLLNMRLQF